MKCIPELRVPDKSWVQKSEATSDNQALTKEIHSYPGKVFVYEILYTLQQLEPLRQEK